MWRYIAGGAAVIFVIVVVIAITLVGPWPTYSRDFADQPYFLDALTTIDYSKNRVASAGQPGQLKAGWAARSITPPVGTPLAGYSARKGAPSTGVAQELYVKALAISDSEDTIVFVGADMLLIPEELADAVREYVAMRTPLTSHDIFFTASHTHSGPGGWTPGLASRVMGGKYVPGILEQLTDAFSESIVEAYGNLEDARISAGDLAAPDYIRNRARPQAPVDDELSFMVVETAEAKCYAVTYSAHPTTIGARNLQFSPSYPGYLMTAIEEETGAFTIYLGGAVGSMGPRAPAEGSAFERSKAMGDALAKLVLDEAEVLRPGEGFLDVAAIGIPFALPPFQIRLSPKWRLSPFLPAILGVDGDGWLHVARVGDLYFVGTPCDFSGEISVKLKRWAASSGKDLWVHSFNGDYVGYVSPDYCYNDLNANGELGYETGLMSWCGPHQEEFFTTLIKHMINTLAVKKVPSEIPQDPPQGQ